MTIEPMEVPEWIPPESRSGSKIGKKLEREIIRRSSVLIARHCARMSDVIGPMPGCGARADIVRVYTDRISEWMLPQIRLVPRGKIVKSYGRWDPSTPADVRDFARSKLESYMPDETYAPGVDTIIHATGYLVAELIRSRTPECYWTVKPDWGPDAHILVLQCTGTVWASFSPSVNFFGLCAIALLYRERDLRDELYDAVLNFGKSTQTDSSA